MVHSLKGWARCPATQQEDQMSVVAVLLQDPATGTWHAELFKADEASDALEAAVFSEGVGACGWEAPVGVMIQTREAPADAALLDCPECRAAWFNASPGNPQPLG